MATFDQLRPEQRAIIELVLQRQQSYDRLSDMLGMPTARVRELARDALVHLAPVTAERVDDEWRGQLTDYLLGQQTGPESTATEGHLKRSEPARSWSLSLIDSLDTLYSDGNRPSIPQGEAPARAGRAAGIGKAGAAGPLSPEAQRVVRRRRLLGGLAALAVAAVLAIVLLRGGDDDEGGGNSNTNQPNQNGAQVVGQVALQGQGNERGEGIAAITERNGQRQLVVQAQGLKPTGSGEAYEVWFYNSPRDARSIGAQVTDRQGNYQGAGPVPANYEKFRFVDISREKIDQNAGHSGESVLRGRISAAQQGAAQPGQQDGAPQSPVPGAEPEAP